MTKALRVLKAFILWVLLDFSHLGELYKRIRSALKTKGD